MHKNLVIVVPGYYETKRKELEAGGRKKVNRDKTNPKATSTVARGGSHGGEGKEFQFQNTMFNERPVTGASKINEEKEACLEGHSIKGGIAISGEYFAEKINKMKNY